MASSDVNTAVAAAVTAIEAGDYATALPKLLAAKAHLSAMPDSQRGSGASLRWDRNAINNLIDECHRGISAAKGIRRQPVKYARTSE